MAGVNQLIVLFVFYCFTSMCNAARILSILPMDAHSTTLIGGSLYALSDRLLSIRLIGVDLTVKNGLFFTTSNSTCSLVKSSIAFYPSEPIVNRTSAVIEVKLEHLPTHDSFWYMCLLVSNNKSNGEEYVPEHQGSFDWLTIKVYQETIVDPYLLPLWLQITLCLILLVLSGLFSGLNLGLMSLDQTELRIIEKVGSDSEKKHARRIGPLRKKGNLLLCTLLLGNVLVNSTFTIFFDNMTNGLIAVICSTIGIVVFGEIIPQAICSRHGLAIGARTYWVTVFFMIVTFPASFPISLVLDFILGEEMGQVFNKEKLQELIRMTADRQVLHDNEANIISGALQLTNKSVEDVMTKIEDVYMLEVNNLLDFDTLTEIMHQGYTRIPVYEGEKINIVNLLNTKDLALIDPDDKTPMSTVCKFYDHRPLFVDYDVRLDAMLQVFLQAGNSHMAIVQKLHNTDDQDPFFETLGVITLEDVIEEILQSEIVDETDLKTDNRQKGVRPLRQKEDYAMLVPDERKSTLPKQLAFAAFQFLTTTVDPFSDVHIARNVLKNLMKKDIVVNLSPTEPVTQKNYIYKKGVSSDKFVLILQGTVEVVIGDESMMFESGPFSYFGMECINSLRKSVGSETKNMDYIPDFSVRAVTDVQYLSIQRAMYVAALRTTRMMRQSGSLVVNDAFEAEYEKIKSSENRSKSNSVSESSSPPPNLQLDTLKFDESAKKKSTSSLDRMTFFHRKRDPVEGLHQIRRTGSDAKDRSPGCQEELDTLVRKPTGESGPIKASGDASITASPSSPSSEKRTNSSSSPSILPQNNHKLNFFQEMDDNGATSGDGIRTCSQGNIPSNFPASSNIDEVSTNKDVKESANNNQTDEDVLHEKVPLVVFKAGIASGQKNVANSANQVSQVNSRANKDAERVPLMNRDAASDEFSSP